MAGELDMNEDELIQTLLDAATQAAEQIANRTFGTASYTYQSTDKNLKPYQLPFGPAQGKPTYDEDSDLYTYNTQGTENALVKVAIMDIASHWYRNRSNIGDIPDQARIVLENLND